MWIGLAKRSSLQQIVNKFTPKKFYAINPSSQCLNFIFFVTDAEAK
jgi:hypothetical protein